SEPGMALDHAQAGAPGDHAELIGIVDLRLEDRGDAVLYRGRRDEERRQHDDGRQRDHPAPPKPKEIEEGDARGNPDSPRLSQHDGQSDQRGAEQPHPEALPDRRGKEQKGRQHDQGEHLFGGIGIPVAGEAGDPLAYVKLVKITAGAMRLLHLAGKLYASADGGERAESRPSEEEEADHRHGAKQRKHDQQLEEDVELANLRKSGGGIVRQQKGNYRAEQKERKRQPDARQAQLLATSQQPGKRERQQDLRRRDSDHDRGRRSKCQAAGASQQNRFLRVHARWKLSVWQSVDCNRWETGKNAPRTGAAHRAPQPERPLHGFRASRKLLKYSLDNRPGSDGYSSGGLTNSLELRKEGRPWKNAP